MRERFATIKDDVASACRRAGRDSSEVLVEAVSKTVDVEQVLAASQAGFIAFAENRPQELVRKLNLLDQEGISVPRFDMIGNLQTNKINAVLGRAALIHSISSLHLAQAVSKRSVTRSVVARVLIEVNISGEQSKSGFSTDELWASLDELLALDGIDIQGLMTMAPAHDAARARQTFSGLRELRDELRERSGRALDVLSCGMSDDYEIAIEEGSTLVRLGRIIFDQNYTDIH
ncbi:MAG: YggS family pyridoxal phosphate-dependent enzyme [Atopobiaceae bacterium]|nr:YggS family pyridoxal phosphate-dependent enzyme [Atopobiaceae bacterium]